jgi:uncharacterized membrane protein YjfL (UPF0719 family)
MASFINIQSILNSVLFSVIGFLMLTAGFWVFDKICPWQLWKEIIDEQNIALAIIVGAMALGISNIIASAIVG